ncbi:nose resistant to fluoxetine protein 6 isoform X2 [Nilaparvata lugens]|uniref:nose resistant to fluoxetine protein 6 isoform X1 n=1 Tax=Nilaparvata lugens TaxID=108931 RepID=UPI00193C9708|nr:nose resistant to fluoxetine protein 6 isoform X1 [Nilaparvata lugens]XP_039295305.1 nose resistant to fluoxetine protein 6 isoform X2 [Nilaparvata lugens]
MSLLPTIQFFTVACLFLGKIGSCDSNTNTSLYSFDNSFEPLTDFFFFPPFSDNITDAKCKLHSRIYQQELRKFTLWAVKMFDSSTKFPTGILSGSHYDFGNFDECLQVQAQLDGELISGKYCLAKLAFSPADQAHLEIFDKTPSLLQYSFNESAWQTIKRFAIDPSKRIRHEVNWALCIPDSCRSQDLGIQLNEALQKAVTKFNFRGQISVDDRNCQTAESALPVKLTTADITFLSIIGFCVTIVILCTMADLFTSISALQKYRPSGYSEKLIEAFSASSNVHKLLTYSDNADGLDCLHGLKFISICLIIMGHRVMFALSTPIVNTDFIEGFYSKILAMNLLNGPIVVDTFFLISGFLVCHLLLEQYQNNKNINIFVLYLHRYIRLTPVYIVLLAFYCTMFIKMGDGPLWVEKVGKEMSRCQTTWWVNLLYINNYVNVDNLCMFQSWYISADFHLFMIAPFIVKLISSRPKFGVAILVALICASTASTFWSIYHKNLDALLLLYIRTLENPLANQTFRDVYMPTHTRATPYFIGIATAYILNRIRAKNIVIPKTIVWTGWLVSIFFVEATIYSAWYFYVPDSNYSALNSAIYGAGHHIMWTLGVCFMIIAMATGNGAFIEPVFAWKPVITLSRLCYCAFLCHGGLQLYSVAALRNPISASLYNLTWFSLGDISLSFSAAFFLSLVFESPILRIESILRKKGLSSESNEDLTKKTDSLETVGKEI